MNRKIPEDTGATQREIVKFLLDHPDGVSEPTIREHLADKLKIKDPSNIKAHLEKLSNMKVIIKEHFRGRPNRWVLAYENQDYVGGYIFWNFIENVKYQEGNKDLAIDVFKSRALQKFIKESDWEPYLLEYIFEGRPSENACNIFKREPILDLISPLVALSPTLFCEMFEPTTECWAMSVSIGSQYYSLGIANKDVEEEDPCELTHFAIGARVVSALLLDRINFPQLTGDIEKFLYDNYVFSYKWSVAYKKFSDYEPSFKNLLINQRMNPNNLTTEQKKWLNIPEQP